MSGFDPGIHRDKTTAGESSPLFCLCAEQEGSSMQMSQTIAVLQCARLISRNLEDAIAFYEAFVPSARNVVLIERVNFTGINGGFNMISESLHHSTIISLCRIWDNRRGVASIWSLKKRLENPKFATEINRDKPVFDGVQFDQWRRKVEKVGGSDELEAIRTSRNSWLAHTKAPDHPYSGVARQAVYGDERRVIEMTKQTK